MTVRRALLAGSALALAVGTLGIMPERAVAARSAFVAPDRPLILTRELRRELHDGKEVVSRRSYEIRFVPEGEGWRVDGVLVASEVEAPPALATLAALERVRKDDGLFPLRLDRQGMILASSGPGGDAPAAIATARSFAGAAIASNAALGADGQVAAKAMLGELSARTQAAGNGWPADLFRPSAGRSSRVERLPLPDGSEGRVTVTTLAEDAASGLLGTLRREVVTELGGTRRASRETFTLALKD